MQDAPCIVSVAGAGTQTYLEQGLDAAQQGDINATVSKSNAVEKQVHYLLNVASAEVGTVYFLLKDWILSISLICVIVAMPPFFFHDERQSCRACYFLTLHVIYVCGVDGQFRRPTFP